MLTLIIDTSTERPAVGLSDGVGPTRVMEPTAPRRHGRDLIPSIRELLQSGSHAVADLEVIGVGVGPGSYTGLRIGLTAAKVLAYTSKAELIPFDSLEAVAQNSPDDATKVVVAADAQRGDVYAAEFFRQGPGTPLRVSLTSRVVPGILWARELPEDAFVLGPALASPRIRGLLPAHVRVDESIPPEPRADRILAMVQRLRAEVRRGDLWTLEPNYLRRSAAEDQWEARPRP